MCTKAEVAEVVASKLAPLAAILSRVESALSSLPCGSHSEKITRLEIQYAALKESSDLNNQEKNDEIYPRLRAVETAITTLSEQNKNQALWSGKVWALITIGITVTLNTLAYFLRG